MGNHMPTNITFHEKGNSKSDLLTNPKVEKPKIASIHSQIYIYVWMKVGVMTKLFRLNNRTK